MSPARIVIPDVPEADVNEVVEAISEQFGLLADVEYEA